MNSLSPPHVLCRAVVPLFFPPTYGSCIHNEIHTCISDVKLLLQPLRCVVPVCYALLYLFFFFFPAVVTQSDGNYSR